METSYPIPYRLIWPSAIQGQRDAFRNILSTTGSSKDKEMTMATTMMLCFLLLSLILLLLKMKWQRKINATNLCKTRWLRILWKCWFPSMGIAPVQLNHMKNKAMWRPCQYQQSRRRETAGSWIVACIPDLSDLSARDQMTWEMRRPVTRMSITFHPIPMIMPLIFCLYSLQMMLILNCWLFQVSTRKESRSSNASKGEKQVTFVGITQQQCPGVTIHHLHINNRTTANRVIQSPITAL